MGASSVLFHRDWPPGAGELCDDAVIFSVRRRLASEAFGLRCERSRRLSTSSKIDGMEAGAKCLPRPPSLNAACKG